MTEQVDPKLALACDRAKEIMEPIAKSAQRIAQVAINIRAMDFRGNAAEQIADGLAKLVRGADWESLGAGLAELAANVMEYERYLRPRALKKEG